MTRSAKNPVRLRRAMVVMMSGLWVPELGHGG
jgi:hypothetical protein